MVRKLAALTLLGLALLGCSKSPENVPVSTDSELKLMNDREMSDEQREARASRPR